LEPESLKRPVYSNAHPLEHCYRHNRHGPHSLCPGLIRGEWIANWRSLPWAILSKGTPLWLPKLFFLALDTAQKPYYVGSRNLYVSALFTKVLLGLVPVPSTRATAAQPPESISLCWCGESKIANTNGDRRSDGSSLSVGFLRPARALAETRVRSVRPLD
jgi:hypothetical protein